MKRSAPLQATHTVAPRPRKPPRKNWPTDLDLRCWKDEQSDIMLESRGSPESGSAGSPRGISRELRPRSPTGPRRLPVGEVVIDLFSGSGTRDRSCLGRHRIGVELQEDVGASREQVSRALNP